MNERQVKIIISGDIFGEFEYLNEFITSTMRSQGDFHYVLAIGNFLGNECSVCLAKSSETNSISDLSYALTSHDVNYDAVSNEKRINNNRYLLGEKHFIIPVFFVDSSLSTTGRFLRQNFSSGYQISSSLYFLGNMGLVKINNILIAYLSGFYNDNFFFSDNLEHTDADLKIIEMQKSSPIAEDTNFCVVKTKFEQYSTDPISTPFNATHLDQQNDQHSNINYNTEETIINSNSLVFGIFKIPITFERVTNCGISSNSISDNDDYHLLYTKKNILQYKKLLDSYKGQVDIFISSEWPSDTNSTLSFIHAKEFDDFLDFRSKIFNPSAVVTDSKEQQIYKLFEYVYKDIKTSGSVLMSPVVSEVVEFIEPRYHISSGANVFYKRIPYKTTKFGYESKFVSLGSFLENKIKLCFTDLKFIYALQILPCSLIKTDILLEVSSLTTLSPYYLLYTSESERKKFTRYSNANKITTKRKIDDISSNTSFGKKKKLQSLINYKDNKFETNDEFYDNPYSILIKNIPSDTDDDSLKSIMSNFGEIVTLKSFTGLNNNHAWLTFRDKNSVNKCMISTNKVKYGNHLLKFYPSNYTVLKRSSIQLDKKHKKSPQAIDIRPHFDCWFCISNSNCEKRLIIAIGEKVYLTLSKGGIVKNHVLIIPITHFPNFLFCPPDVGEEMTNILSSLKMCYESQESAVVVYERYFPMKSTTGMHMQLQVVPIHKRYISDISEAFMRHAHEIGIKLFKFKSDETIFAMRRYVEDNILHAYFYLEISGIYPNTCERWIYTSTSNENKLIFNFGRDVIANILECPEKANWKACIKEEALENEEVQQMKMLYSAYQQI